MSTTTHGTTALSNRAQAIAIRNRLQRDLAELTNTAQGAERLVADEEGAIFDVACYLTQSTAALRDAILALGCYAEQAS